MTAAIRPFTVLCLCGFAAGQSAAPTATGPATFTATFELARPGQDFELYEETRFRRKQ